MSTNKYARSQLTLKHRGGSRFIYEVYEQSRLPWVYGGEYEAFARCVVQVVEAWIAVGLKVYFVFDGGTSSDLTSSCLM